MALLFLEKYPLESVQGLLHQQKDDDGDSQGHAQVPDEPERLKGKETFDGFLNRIPDGEECMAFLLFLSHYQHS